MSLTWEEQFEAERELRAVGEEPLCTDCGHKRSEHDEEMPYECMNGDMCDCPSFSYVKPTIMDTLRRIKDESFAVARDERGDR